MVNVGLIIIFIGSLLQLIAKGKEAHNHMIIKLINICLRNKIFRYQLILYNKHKY